MHRLLPTPVQTRYEVGCEVNELRRQSRLRTSFSTSINSRKQRRLIYSFRLWVRAQYQSMRAQEHEQRAACTHMQNRQPSTEALQGQALAGPGQGGLPACQAWAGGQRSGKLEPAARGRAQLPTGPK